jgi:hypothetical protein
VASTHWRANPSSRRCWNNTRYNQVRLLKPLVSHRKVPLLKCGFSVEIELLSFEVIYFVRQSGTRRTYREAAKECAPHGVKYTRLQSGASRSLAFSGCPRVRCSNAVDGGRRTAAREAEKGRSVKVGAGGWAERDWPILRSTGAHHLILARKPE